jgi:Fic family protein
MTESKSGRAGRYINQLTGYRAFIPAPLPPEPPLAISPVELGLLSEADQALGRLDGVASILPNPSLFVAMYVRREAVLSSQIEGTQSTLDDVLTYELEGESSDLPVDVHEVVNYVRAMYRGLARLSELPVSLRLIREIHAELLATGRGAERQPGEFRTSQNWIGPEGGTLATARFVPPPPHEMNQALDNLEKYLHAPSPWPHLIDLAMVHAQFETIHPFLDGNGRVGRLLVTFMLVQRQVLRQPLLYLSYYLRLHRTEYYDRLTAIREQGDWEGWIRFFLDGVRVTASEATHTAARIIALQEHHRHRVADLGTNALKLLDHLFQQPLVNINAVRTLLDVSFPTAAKLVSSFEELGILSEVTGFKRNRVYRYDEYLGLFSEPAANDDPGALEATESDS